MPRIPRPASVTPTTATEITPATDYAPVAQPTDAITDEMRREAADYLGLNLENMGDEDRGFMDVFLQGQLNSIEPDADPENPLIPSADDTPPEPVDTDGATTVDDGAGVGPGSTSGDAAVPVATDTDGGDPSAATPPTPTIPPSVPEVAMVDLGPDIGLVPVDQVRAFLQSVPQLTPEEVAYINAARAGVVAPQFIDPRTGLPFPAQPSAAQGGDPGGGVPLTAPPPGFTNDEYIDTRAAADIAQLNARFDQLNASQRQVIEARVNEDRQRLATGVQVGAQEFASARGLEQTDLEELLTSLGRLGTLGQYGQMYPDDPSSAVKAALDSVYWSTPKFREREVQRALEQHAQDTKEVTAKKALAAGITSTPGSTPRTPPPAANRDDRLSGMVAMIEAAQNGAGSDAT